MDLVDRYVAAVKRHLPVKMQDDIANELTDDILSQIRDKEDGLGRALDVTEQEAVLKQYGHPYLLATRYRPQQYLIGPALFPFYFPAMKIAMGMAFAVQVIVAFSIGLGQRMPERIVPRILDFPDVAFHVAFWVTLAFAVADHFHGKLNLFDSWSPRTLPPVTRPSRPPSRGNLVFETVVNILFIGWWLSIPTYPFLMLGPAASFLQLSPSWARLYYPALIPAIVSVLLATLAVVRPAWTWMPRVRALVVDVLTIAVFSAALNAGDLIIAAKPTPELLRLVDGINRVTTVVLVVISLITMVKVFVGIYQLVRPSASES
jgi:hypothetical protein